MRRLLGAAILTAMSAFPAAQHLIEGAAQSPVRVVIYEDLQCPDCADFRVMLDEKLLPRYAVHGPVRASRFSSRQTRLGAKSRHRGAFL